MDEQTSKLEQAKADYLDKQKRLALLDAGISYNDVSTYVKYVKATSNAEIKQQAEELAQDISAHNTARFDTHHDKRTLTLFDK